MNTDTKGEAMTAPMKESIAEFVEGTAKAKTRTDEAMGWVALCNPEYTERELYLVRKGWEQGWNAGTVEASRYQTPPT